MVYPPTNYLWKCVKCGEILYGHKESGSIIKCAKCDGEMVGGPIIHRGPSPLDDEESMKKY